MNNLKICMFAYNFEHKKSQEGIIKLLYSNYKINQVVGMNKKKIEKKYYLETLKICKDLKKSIKLI